MHANIRTPCKLFGPSMLCSYCGSMWSKVDHRVRLTSSKRPGKIVKKLMRCAESTEKKLAKVKKTLVKKAAKNRSNKLVIRCSFCSKDTEIVLNRPARLKPPVIQVSQDDSDEPIAKKKKKKSKDKTAGLIIPGNQNCTANLNITKSKSKPKATNLKKLGAMIANNITPSKKSSLHDFIMDLS